jgi:hypothetical protein
MAGVGPAFLAGDDDADPGFTVTSDVGARLIEMTVRGRLDQRLSTGVYAGLRKCLAEHPAAIIVDLHGLDDPYGASAAMWLAVNRSATGMLPPVRLVLTMPSAAPLTGRLRRLGAGRFPPVHTTVAEARDAVAGPPPTA